MYTLITSATSAKAYQLKNMLQAPAGILLGDYMELPEIMLKGGAMLKLPNPASETYPHEMLALCLDNQVNTLYLLQPQEMQALAPAELLFNEYGINLIAAYDKV